MIITIRYMNTNIAHELTVFYIPEKHVTVVRYASTEELFCNVYSLSDVDVIEAVQDRVDNVNSRFNSPVWFLEVDTSREREIVVYINPDAELNQVHHIRVRRKGIAHDYYPGERGYKRVMATIIKEKYYTRTEIALESYANPVIYGSGW